MDKQPQKETILKKAIEALVNQAGLSAEEVAGLRLTDLHLAGKTPNLPFSVVEGEPPKKVELDLDAHRALVGWLVARPDSVTDLLFVDVEAEALSPYDIQQFAGEPAPPPPAESPPAEVAGQKPLHPPEHAAHEIDETMIGSRPVPPIARPGAPKPPPPGSAPEVGAPPPGFATARVHPIYKPPTTAPEEDEVSESSEPITRKVPLEKAAEAMPFPPRPEGEKKPRVPPKPVRKRGITPVPVLMKQEPAPPPGPPAPTAELEAEAPTPPAESEKSTEETPPPEKSDTSTLPAADAPKAEAKPPAPPKVKKAKSPVLGAPAQKEGRSKVLPAALGGVGVLLLLCVVCAGFGGWMIFQSDTGSQVLAGLGLSQSEPLLPTGEVVVVLPSFTPTFTATPTGSSIFESPISPVSPLETPTLPSTSTATPLPPTNTPSAPTETPTPIVQDTPVPTDTPPPTATPTPEPAPEAGPTPEESPTPAAPAMKYGAPVLLAPNDGVEFTGINEITLEWEPVGELEADEQYAVRLVYRFNSEVTYGGAQVKEPGWVVPLQLYQKIDPPENRYEWFVAVERLNDDGSGTAISPESERMSFSWK